MSIALITGGNRGLGLATAHLLAQQGHEVIIRCRDERAGAQAAERLGSASGDVTALTMDVTDPETIAAAAKWVESRHGKLDILVNNAGILPEATQTEPAEAVDSTMFRTTYETNVFGPVAVLEAFLPLLRNSEGGRVVNVSTTMGSLADQTDPASPYYTTVVPAYQSSKAALNNITIALAKQLVDTPIKVVSVCPGFVRTDLTPINREQAPLTADEAAEIVCHAATLPEDAESGTFIDSNGQVPW